MKIGSIWSALSALSAPTHTRWLRESMRRRSPLKETMPTRRSYTKVPSSPNQAAFQIAYDLEGGGDEGGAVAYSPDVPGLIRVARANLRCLSTLAFFALVGLLMMRRGEFDTAS